MYYVILICHSCTIWSYCTISAPSGDREPDMQDGGGVVGETQHVQL